MLNWLVLGKSDRSPKVSPEIAIAQNSLNCWQKHDRSFRTTGR
ncbi:hypothetical protein [Pseudanabaena sp. PCC 6802]|nr:hypothetical protein [Pseudanabaena sp. PCC 6802]